MVPTTGEHFIIFGRTNVIFGGKIVIFGVLFVMIVTRLRTKNPMQFCDFPRILESESNLTEVFEKEKITPDVVPPLSPREMKQLGGNTTALYLRQNPTSEFDIQVLNLV